MLPLLTALLLLASPNAETNTPDATAQVANATTQTPASDAATTEKATSTKDAIAIAARSAEAAEKAAQSAQAAAESAAKLAAAFDKLASTIEAAKSAEPSATPAGDASDDTSNWSGIVGLSLISLTGNSNSITTSANASLRRESKRWIFELKAGGAYGRTRAADSIDEVTGELIEADPEIVALNANVDLRADLRFTSKISVYLLAGVMTDHVKSVETKPVGEAGLSVIWLDQKKGDVSTLRLQTDFAFRGGKELRFQYYPEPTNLEDQVIAAPRFALAFRYALTDGLILTEDFEVLPNVIGDSRVWLSSLTKISVKLIKALSFNTSFLVTHDTAPADGKEKTDTALTVGLEVAF